MKFEIEQCVLMEALKRVKGCIEVRTSIPVLRNVWIEVANGNLELRGNNLDKEMRVNVDLPDGWEAGKTTVEFQFFEGYCSKHPKNAMLKVETLVDNGRLKVSRGRGSSTLNTLPTDDYPDLENLANDTITMLVTADDMKSLLSKVQIAMSTEETRYYLNGIYLHVTDVDGVPTLRAVATDGHRLGYAQMKAPEDSENMPGIIVPRGAVRDIVDMCKPGEMMEMTVSRTKIDIRSGPCRLISKLIDGVFPDYVRVIPRNNDKPAVVDRKEVMTMVDRVAAVGGERGRAVKFAFTDGKLTMSVANPDSGTASDEAEVKFDSDDVDVGFNHAYVTSILETIESDTVQIDLADPGSPTLFRKPGDESALYVLMPMRV